MSLKIITDGEDPAFQKYRHILEGDMRKMVVIAADQARDGVPGVQVIQGASNGLDESEMCSMFCLIAKDCIISAKTIMRANGLTSKDMAEIFSEVIGGDSDILDKIAESKHDAVESMKQRAIKQATRPSPN